MSAPTGTDYPPYSIEVAFSAPVSTVTGPEATLTQVVAERLRMPESHNFALGQVAVGANLERHAGIVTFVSWEGDSPNARVASVCVEVYKPGSFVRAFAALRRREPNASVNVAAYGSKPLGGGDLTNAPDNSSLPLGPATEFVDAQV